MMFGIGKKKVIPVGESFQDLPPAMDECEKESTGPDNSSFHLTGSASCSQPRAKGGRRRVVSDTTPKGTTLTLDRSESHTRSFESGKKSRGWGLKGFLGGGRKDKVSADLSPLPPEVLAIKIAGEDGIVERPSSTAGKEGCDGKAAEETGLLSMLSHTSLVSPKAPKPPPERSLRSPRATSGRPMRSLGAAGGEVGCAEEDEGGEGGVVVSNASSPKEGDAFARVATAGSPNRDCSALAGELLDSQAFSTQKRAHRRGTGRLGLGLGGLKRLLGRRRVVEANEDVGVSAEGQNVGAIVVTGCGEDGEGGDEDGVGGSDRGKGEAMARGIDTESKRSAGAMDVSSGEEEEAMDDGADGEVGEGRTKGSSSRTTKAKEMPSMSIEEEMELNDPLNNGYRRSKGMASSMRKAMRQGLGIKLKKEKEAEKMMEVVKEALRLTHKEVDREPSSKDGEFFPSNEGEQP